jgi:serine/threonine-protein kinase
MSSPGRELGDLQQALGDRYVVERELGRGGMGAVYLARDQQLDRRVAIKVLPREMATDSMLRERFLRETRTAASFSHPNIVPVHAVEERPHLLAFVMGYVEGESLSQRVARAGPLEAREILRLLLDVGYALAYAHGRDVVHRDVKPDNVMIERATGRALLMDFGISRSVAAEASMKGVTRIGEVVGTPEYMSPEQSVGDVLDGRSDLYSLALTAYFAATGKPVFGGETTQKILMRQLSETPPPLSSVRPDLPRVLVDAVERSLAKDPNERFENAGAMVSALEGAQSFAPDVPMPIRLFTQEVGTLGMVAFFFCLLVWIMTAALGTDGDDDLFIPIVLLFAILLGRVAQTLGDARRLIRHGFSRDEIRKGMRAVVNERETRRIQLRSDPATRRMRRKTVASALFMVITAAVLIKLAMKFRFPQEGGGYRVELPGAVMFLSALLQLGFGLPLLMRSPLRMPLAERLFRLIWLGPPGGVFFRVASSGLEPDTVRTTKGSIAVLSPPTPKVGNDAKPRVSHASNGNTPVQNEVRLAALEERVALLERASRQG